MKPKMIAALGLAWLLSGCAGLQFSKTDTAGKGVPFYAKPVPYLLVTFEGDTCKPKGDVIYIPDTSEESVRYVRPRSGLGKADMSATFENGMLKSFNSNVDNSSVSSTIKDIAGLVGVGPKLSSTAPSTTPSFLGTDKQPCLPAQLFRMVDGKTFEKVTLPISWGGGPPPSPSTPTSPSP